MQDLLTPQHFNDVKNLRLLAKLVVEGFASGLHRSLQHGQGTEFEHYRNYTPGDDLKLVDWKAYLKHKKFYTKIFKEETCMNCNIILDCSGSMNYQGKKSDVSKFRYASVISACLAYLIDTQHDNFGFYAYNKDIVSMHPASHRKSNLNRILGEISKLEAIGESDHDKNLQIIGSLLKGRGIIIYISDMLDGEDKILQFLRTMSSKHFDCLLVQILDRDEEDFPFDGNIRFVEIETNQEIVTAPENIREDYLSNLNKHKEKIKKLCLDNKIDYTTAITDEFPISVLSSYLNHRDSF